MLIRLHHKQTEYQADLADPLDISIPIGQARCFFAPKVEFKAFESGNFIGAVKAGSPVNFFNIFFNPHGNGTHTECMGHISIEQESINRNLKKFHFLAALISIAPQASGEDLIVRLEDCKTKLGTALPEALIIRTLPNEQTKRIRDYSGKNPPYLEKELIDFLVAKGVKHLLLDLPSVDREEDEGKLSAHKAFWNFPSKDRLDCTITELVFIPDEVEDGSYLLNLQIAPFDLDASPSKPVLYRLLPVT